MATDAEEIIETEIDESIAPQGAAEITPAPPVHVMLDLETMGTGNEALIMSIGATRFDEDVIYDNFHVAVDPVSAQELGLKIDADTILWWFDPGRDAARNRWLGMEKVDLASALTGFTQWIKGHQPIAIWGNGSTFDNVILRSAFAAAGLEYPVRFWQDACYRTIKQRSPVGIERVGTHHDALDDAITQAKHLQAIWRHEDPRDLRTMLERCQQQFTHYGQQHRAKGTAEAVTKAEVNEQLALEIRQLLNSESTRS